MSQNNPPPKGFAGGFDYGLKLAVDAIVGKLFGKHPINEETRFEKKPFFQRKVSDEWNEEQDWLPRFADAFEGPQDVIHYIDPVTGQQRGPQGLPNKRWQQQQRMYQKRTKRLQDQFQQLRSHCSESELGAVRDVLSNDLGNRVNSNEQIRNVDKGNFVQLFEQLQKGEPIQDVVNNLGPQAVGIIEDAMDEILVEFKDLQIKAGKVIFNGDQAPLNDMVDPPEIVGDQDDRQPDIDKQIDKAFEDLLQNVNDNKRGEVQHDKFGRPAPGPMQWDNLKHGKMDTAWRAVNYNSLGELEYVNGLNTRQSWQISRQLKGLDRMTYTIHVPLQSLYLYQLQQTTSYYYRQPIQDFVNSTVYDKYQNVWDSYRVLSAQYKVMSSRIALKNMTQPRIQGFTDVLIDLQSVTDNTCVFGSSWVENTEYGHVPAVMDLQTFAMQRYFKTMLFDSKFQQTFSMKNSMNGHDNFYLETGVAPGQFPNMAFWNPMWCSYISLPEYPDDVSNLITLTLDLKLVIQFQGQSFLIPNQ